MINTQKPEPVRRDTDGLIDLHSVFPTIQGEGPYTGQRAVFVRLAGCTLACKFCDTEYTRGRRLQSVDQICTAVLEAVGDADKFGYLVVLTGGEPLRQPVGPLIKTLLAEGYRVQIESNGAVPPDDKLLRLFYYEPQDRLCLIVSPKTKSVHPDCYRHAHAFKYVLDHLSIESDGLPLYALDNEAGKGCARPRPGAPVYLTPCDVPEDPARTQVNVKAVVRSAVAHGYIAGIQLHKLLELA